MPLRKLPDIVLVLLDPAVVLLEPREGLVRAVADVPADAAELPKSESPKSQASPAMMR